MTTTNLNDDVAQQAAANAEAERQRKNTIRNAAKALREKAAEIRTANKKIRDEMAEYKDVCGADLLELRAENEKLAAEQAELKNKLALLKATAGVK